MNLRRTLLLALTVFAAVTTGVAEAQAPFLVEDINLSSPQSSDPRNFVSVGTTTVFVAVTETGRDLWKTDGTAAGTMLLRDFIPSGWSNAFQYPFLYAKLNGFLFFVADDVSTNGADLWKTDGTAAGTTVVKDFVPPDARPQFPRVVGDTLFFTANDGVNGRELWKTDGTEAGTLMVKDLNPGPYSSSPQSLSLFNGVLHFAYGSTIWKSDGSDAGTQIVAAIAPYRIVKSLVSAGTNLLVFALDTETLGYELWKTDGTQEGTTLLRDGFPYEQQAPYTTASAVGDLFYFSATDGISGEELWRSDGTVSGTQMIEIEPGPGGSLPNGFRMLGAELYFSAYRADTGDALWKSDGSVAGTFMVVDPAPSAASSMYLLAVSGSMLLLNSWSPEFGHELWRSDGTAPGTQLLKDISPGLPGSDPRSVGPAGSPILYFSADDETTGFELWKTDGTEAGTTLVANLRPDTTGSSSPVPLAAHNGFLLLQAFCEESGQEVWRSDGTSEGTSLVEDLTPGETGTPISSAVSIPTGLVFGGRQMPGLGVVDPVGHEPWFTDGTAQGTYLLRDILPGPEGSLEPSDTPLALAAMGGSAYFVASESLDRTQAKVWKTDGTPLGTVKIVNEAQPYRFYEESELIPSGNLVFFLAHSDEFGRELWRTDGTDAGTFPLDLTPGSSSSNSFGFTDVDGTLFFFSGNYGSYTLSKSDGTVEGTVAIATGLNVSGPTKAANGFLFFVTFESGRGPQLWKSDGTSGGTRLVRELNSNSGSITSYGQVGENIFFVTWGGELWKTDGSESGTVFLRFFEITAPANLTSFDGKLYFSGFDPATGWEVWTSDGTPEGTNLAFDLALGPESSFARDFLEAGGLLYFSAFTPDVGRELWAIPSQPQISSVSPAYGPIAGGTQVTIEGTSYAPDAAVTIDGIAATVISRTDSRIVVVTPAHVQGSVDVIVANRFGNPAVAAGAFTYIETTLSFTGVAPDSGIATGNVEVTVSGGPFTSGAAVYFEERAGSTTSTTASSVVALTPSLNAGTLYDMTVVNPDGSAAFMPNAFFADFLDVAASNAFHDFIETLVRENVTLGCSAGYYCPTQTVTRLQMAIFIARAKLGGDANVPQSGMVGSQSYTCGSGGTTLFADVPATSPFCGHVHYIASQNITQGCSPESFCPAPGVTREQTAAFLARALTGSDSAVPSVYADPTTGRSYNLSTGLRYFTDTATSVFDRHAHYIWARGVADGCAAQSYCPRAVTNRAQMAKFLVNAFLQ